MVSCRVSEPTLAMPGLPARTLCLPVWQPLALRSRPWVCRGDLGAQASLVTDLHPYPGWQGNSTVPRPSLQWEQATLAGTCCLWSLQPL
jgi:hypothetical protein